MKVPSCLLHHSQPLESWDWSKWILLHTKVWMRASTAHSSLKVHWIQKIMSCHPFSRTTLLGTVSFLLYETSLIYPVSEVVIIWMYPYLQWQHGLYRSFLCGPVEDQVEANSSSMQKSSIQPKLLYFILDFGRWLSMLWYSILPSWLCLLSYVKDSSYLCFPINSSTLFQSSHTKVLKCKKQLY